MSVLARVFRRMEVPGTFRVPFGSERSVQPMLIPIGFHIDPRPLSDKSTTTTLKATTFFFVLISTKIWIDSSFPPPCLFAFPFAAAGRQAHPAGHPPVPVPARGRRLPRRPPQRQRRWVGMRLNLVRPNPVHVCGLLCVCSFDQSNWNRCWNQNFLLVFSVMKSEIVGAIAKEGELCIWYNIA